MVKSLNGNKTATESISFENVYDIRVIRGKHPNFTKETYAVQFESKLAGNYVDCYLGLAERIN